MPMRNKDPRAFYGTLNEKTTVGDETAERDLIRFLMGVDVAALQEWGGNRNDILRHVGSLLRFKPHAKWVRAMHRKGWTFVRPTLGGGPVGFLGPRFAARVARTRFLCGPSMVNPDPGNPRRLLGPSKATLAIADDLYTNEKVAVVNFHLTAGLQGRDGKYKKGSRARRHRKEVRRLAALGDRLHNRGFVVRLMGDTNFDGLQIPGWVSCWDGVKHKPGTHGKRTIDHIYAKEDPSLVSVWDQGHSDHNGVHALY